MKKNKKGVPLSTLIKNPEHYQEILRMYLDFSKPVKLSVRGGKHWLIQATGEGLDGEIQNMIINENTGFRRWWKSNYKDLPIHRGKIYYRLQQLGYDVGINGSDRAERYHNYAINGISNLGKNDHREALVEKELRASERRKSTFESMDY